MYRPVRNFSLWTIRYKDLLSGTYVISLLYAASIPFIGAHPVLLCVLGLLIPVWYSINFYILKKRCNFKGRFREFLLGFLPFALLIAVIERITRGKAHPAVRYKFIPDKRNRCSALLCAVICTLTAVFFLAAGLFDPKLLRIFFLMIVFALSFTVISLRFLFGSVKLTDTGITVNFGLSYVNYHIR